ncbi:MAG: ABC transporter permease [Acidobacteriota bacterium]
MILKRLGHRLRHLISPQRLERELDEELQFHLDMEAAKLREQGLDEAEARRRAAIGFGAEERFREECREARGTRPIEDLLRDLRLGLRSLRRRPGHSLLVVLILALAVGGTSAIFGTVQGVLLTPLPFPEVERVMTLWQTQIDGSGRENASPANFLDWRERSESFEQLAALEPYGFAWQGPEGPRHLHTWLVSEGFFEVIGTQPNLGRTFESSEHQSGTAGVVVLGHRLWQDRLNGDPDILGKALILDGQPYSVVGVMPEGFAFPSDDALWAPKVWEGWESRARRGGFYSVFGRLAPAVSRQEAETEMAAIAQQLAAEHPTSNAESRIALVPLAEHMLGNLRRPLWLLLAAVSLVLLIAAANLTSLQLTRAIGRLPEFGVRTALGANRGRIARQVLTESLCLAGAGALFGFAVGAGLLGLLRNALPAGFPRLEELRVDSDFLVFTAVTSLLVVLVSSSVPLLLANRRPSPRPLQGDRISRGPLVGRVQRGLIVFQIGISLVLLVSAGLLLRSFLAVLAEDPGYRIEGVTVTTVQSWDYYPETSDRAAFVERVLAALQQLPGVHAAAMTSSVPLMESIGADRASFVIEDQPLAAGEMAPEAHFSRVSESFFETLAIPLRRGRLFDLRDHADAPSVVLINQALARRYWPETDPIGRTITLDLGRRTPSCKIVGIVGDVRHGALQDSAPPAVYLPHAQQPTGANAFVTWSDRPVEELQAAIRQELWNVNPAIPVYSERTLAELAGASVQERSLLLALLVAFALGAVGLAAVGIFGLTSFAASDRTREIGVRMAFGAQQRDVLAMMLRSGTWLAAIGIALGLAGALLATRLLAGSLHKVTPFDPLTFLAGTTLLLVIVLAANWLPARRATRVDPVVALRRD